MLINAGRAIILLVWGFLLVNLLKPFPVPVNYFLYFSLGFMVFMHSLKLLMLKSTLMLGEQKLTALEQLRIFLFGVFELLAWQRKQQQNKNN